MTSVHDYLVARYGRKDSDSTLYNLIQELQNKVQILEEQYKNALHDIKLLKEENTETSNSLYELQNSIEAFDERINILFSKK